MESPIAPRGKVQEVVSALSMVFVLMAGSACTREGGGGSVRIQIPTKLPSQKTQSKASTLSLNDAEVEYVAVNIRRGLTGFPFVKEFEFHESSAPTGAYLTLEIPNPPTGTGMFVQFLGAYNDNGSMLISYGDSGNLIEIKDGSQNVVNINAAVFSSAGKEGVMAGRVLSSQNPDVGPTGVMITKFNPPGGKPSMNLDVSEIWNGWFSVFALDSADVSFDYVMPDGTVVFDNLSTNSPIFTSGFSDHKVKISAPTSYRNDYDEGLRQYLPTDMVFGFFPMPGFAAGNFSTYDVCYSNLDESIMGFYTDSVLSTPLVWDSDHSGGTRVKVAQGGFSRDFEMTFASTGCDPSGSNGFAMKVYQQSLMHHGGEAIGVHGPFQLMDPVSRWGGYLLMGYDTATDTISLNWKYLPGAGSVVAGATVFAKYNEWGGGGFDGGRESTPCDMRAYEMGYSPAGELSGGAEIFAAHGTVAGHAIDDTNKNNFSFLVCPYRNEGARRYSSFGAHSSCLSGSCGDAAHFGWAVPGTHDKSINSTTSFRTDSASGLDRATFSKVTAVTAVSSGSPAFTEIAVYNDSGNAVYFTAGAEIMLFVAAEADNACPEFSGEEVGPGYTVFSRLLGSDSSGTLKLRRGTFLDEMTGAATELAATGSGAQSSGRFCYVQIYQIPHFYDLALSADLFPYNHLNLGDSIGGGFVGLRVSGTLTASSGARIHANASGFSGGSPPSNGYGAGVLGHSSTTEGSATGGRYFGSSPGGGGGGIGTGGGWDAGNGLGLATIMGGPEFLNGLPFGFFPGGGGGGVSSSTSGGNGGGFVFLAAKNIALNADLSIESNGQSGLVGIFGSGGGGGGSVNVLAKKIVSNSSATLTLSAKGGDGGDTGGSAGYVGGGGFARLIGCEALSGSLPTIASSIVSIDTAKGANGTSTGAADGSAEQNSGMSIWGFGSSVNYMSDEFCD